MRARKVAGDIPNAAHLAYEINERGEIGEPFVGAGPPET